MKKHPVVFIASKEYDNLGIGYMAALLSAEGFRTNLIDFHNKKANILRTLKKIEPQIIGFSVIYQYNIIQFADLINYLRKEGIDCHFTAGGHYASLKYEELFDFIPSLDSIVRFEGEYTMLELVKCVHSGKDWRKTDGISYKANGKIITNRLRPIENDLDKFPFPQRASLRKFAFEIKFTTILAGRGCVHDCSFCNTKIYYSQSSGPIKRIRKPEMVVKEMAMLHNKRNCLIFLFLDDDFPLKSAHKSEWIIKFCDELRKKGLNERIAWKICCRPDEVDEKSFDLMKRNGLFLVFLGIEDGTDTGLERLNKHMTVARSIEGINVLKKLNIGFDYGFLLFQPWSTYKSVNDNLDFLRQICGDGYTPARFLKLMPYYETRVEKELVKGNRLKISPGIRDYDFTDASMNYYYDFITDCFMEWLRYPDGLENLSSWVRNYFLVYSRFFGSQANILKLYRKFTKIVSESNLFLLDTMKELSVIFESGQYKNDKSYLLKSYKENIISKHNFFKGQIHNCNDNLYTLALKNVLYSVIHNHN
jgi:radical SAM superfamily enzyme YgiQ (UPF0313 family)